MYQEKQTTRIDDGDKLNARLLQVGNDLKPIDDANYFFFEIVRELVDAALTNYRQMRQGFNERNYALLAWACRNLLELTIFLKYVLSSGANARRFAADRLVDGCEIIEALRDLEMHLDPKTPTTALDETLSRMQAQMDIEGIPRMKHLAVGRLAEMVGFKQEYASVNRVCSKLVHPSGWSVLAMNRGINSFPDSREILFLYGIGYIAQMCTAIKEHNKQHGLRPIS